MYGLARVPGLGEDCWLSLMCFVFGHVLYQSTSCVNVLWGVNGRQCLMLDYNVHVIQCS